MSERTLRGRVGQRLGFDVRASVPEASFVTWLMAFHVASMVAVLAPLVSDVVWIRAAFIFLDLTFVPGMLLLVAFDELEVELERLLYAMGASLVLVMATGVVLNLALPAIGIGRPLSIPYLVGGTTVLVGILATVAYNRASRRGDRLDLYRAVGRPLTPAVPLFALLIPGTALALDVLEVFDNNVPLLVVLTLIALVPLGVTIVRRFHWHAFAVWCMSLSLLYHSTLAPGAFGGSSVPMHIMEVQRWTPGIENTASTTTSLVPNGILYPTYATLIDIPYYMQTSFVNPILVSLLPVILFVAYRKYVTDTMALLGVSIFMFAHPFYRLYPGGGRVATPVIFLALIGLLIADDELEPVRVHVLAIMFAAGLVISHYGTSYFAMLAFFGAFLSLSLLPYVERWLSDSVGGIRSEIHDWVQITSRNDETKVVTVTFVSFFAVLVMAWYMYTSGGNHFSLPKHIARSLGALFGGDFFTGSTANRVTKSYGPGTQSITYSRYIYMSLIGLMGVGIATELFRRLRRSVETLFDDEFLVVGGIFLATAGSSFVLPTGWGGGRPMMIAFTFSAVFAAVGAVALARLGWTVLERAIENWHPLAEGQAVRIAQSALAVILAVFLMLNTGVLAATAIGGTAPMTVPLETNLEESQNPDFRARAYVDTDVQTHAWLLDHRSGEYGIRGDLIASGQTDKYRSSIAFTMEKDVVFPYSGGGVDGYLDQLGESRDTRYVLIFGHNQNLDVYTLNSTYESKPLDPLHDEIEARSRIYSTGNSAIYFGGNGTAIRR